MGNDRYELWCHYCLTWQKAKTTNHLEFFWDTESGLCPNCAEPICYDSDCDGAAPDGIGIRKG